ncbi:MAG TPA: 3-methyl-2-oxobutanoate hydroxymethyltransferase, partial [Aquificaceae bacterium]|nr:3-methyl-2-oxobutanoate hydroxymethyltransferase [Aquificaceae bacterium]
GAELFRKALMSFKEEVEKGIFPSQEESYG